MGSVSAATPYTVKPTDNMAIARPLMPDQSSMRRKVPLGGVAQTAWGKSPLPLQVRGLAALNFSAMSELMLTVRDDPDEETGTGVGSLEVEHRAEGGTTM